MDEAETKNEKKDVIMDYMAKFVKSEEKDREKVLENLCKLINRYDTECL